MIEKLDLQPTVDYQRDAFEKINELVKAVNAIDKYIRAKQELSVRGDLDQVSRTKDKSTNLINTNLCYKCGGPIALSGKCRSCGTQHYYLRCASCGGDIRRSTGVCEDCAAQHYFRINQ